MNFSRTPKNLFKASNCFLTEPLVPKAVGSDLDGTLLPSNKKLTVRFVDVLARMEKRNILFFPVTGRTLNLTAVTFSALEVPMVCLDGAVIKDRGRVLWDERSLLSPDFVRSILKSTSLPLFLIDDDVIYLRKGVEEKHYCYWSAKLDSPPEKASLERTTHVVIPWPEKKALLKVKESLFSRAQPEIACFLSPHPIQESFYLVFRSRHLSKFRGSSRLLAEYGLTIDEMLFFGDWRNDIPLLKRVGFPVVMRNAGSDVAAYARAMTLFSNEEMGVERFLMSFFEL